MKYITINRIARDQVYLKNSLETYTYKATNRTNKKKPQSDHLWKQSLKTKTSTVLASLSS